MDSGLTHLSSNRMNDKVDTKFSQMHSKFVLLKEKENKLNFEIKKEEILNQKSQNLPGHIIKKYSKGDQKGEMAKTTGGTLRNHFGSVSGWKNSAKTHSPERNKMQSKFLKKLQIKSPNKNEKEEVDQVGKNRRRRDSREIQESSEEYEEIKGNQPKRGSKGTTTKTPKKEERNQPKGSQGKGITTSERLKNLSVVKIHNRFNQMISEFDNIDVNRSYLENGFQNMNDQFGVISETRIGEEAPRNANGEFAEMVG